MTLAASLLAIAAAAGKPGAELEKTAARPGELPDTVLARVAGTRDVTRSRLLAAWTAGAGAGSTQPTPTEAAGFLEVLVDRELLGEAAAAEPWVFSPGESAQARSLADRLAMSAALDSILGEVRAGLPAGTTTEDLGVAARDTVLGRIEAGVDRALLARLAPAWTRLPRPSADSSLAAQLRAMAVLPEVAAADTPLVAGRSRAGEVRVADLLDSWRRLHFAYRPRIDGPDQLEDLVRNGLFERALRLEVRRRRLIESPAVRAEVGRLYESFAVEKLVRRETPAREPDPAALERWFAANRDAWRVPERLRAIRLDLDSRAEAGRTAAMLRDAAAAESLAARAERAGIRYRVHLTAAADSALFAAGLTAGPGSVVGPVSGDRGWSVARIEAILPARVPDLVEVRAEAVRRWQAEQAERAIRALCARLSRRFPVIVHERALATLGR